MNIKAALSITLLCLFTTTATRADPPPWAGHGKHHHRHHHKHRHNDDYRVVYIPAPTMVETRVYRQSVAPVARMPYGFDRGTCDRGLVSSELMGNVVGGVAGGMLGTQIGRGSGRTAATIGGTLIGTVVGGSVGRSMDGIDQGCAYGALDHVPDRRTIAWSGEDGDNYRVMPTRSWQDGRQYCREYQAIAVIGGRRQQTYGTACRMPDGQWEIMD